MSSMGRAVLITVAVGLGLTAVTVGTAAVVGVPEKWFGTLQVLSGIVGCFVGAHVLLHENESARR